MMFRKTGVLSVVFSHKVNFETKHKVNVECELSALYFEHPQLGMGIMNSEQIPNPFLAHS